MEGALQNSHSPARVSHPDFSLQRAAVVCLFPPETQSRRTQITTSDPLPSPLQTPTSLEKGSGDGFVWKSLIKAASPAETLEEKGH